MADDLKTWAMQAGTAPAESDDLKAWAMRAGAQQAPVPEAIATMPVPQDVTPAGFAAEPPAPGTVRPKGLLPGFSSLEEQRAYQADLALKKPAVGMNQEWHQPRPVTTAMGGLRAIWDEPARLKAGLILDEAIRVELEEREKRGMIIPYLGRTKDRNNEIEKIRIDMGLVPPDDEGAYSSGYEPRPVLSAKARDLVNQAVIAGSNVFTQPPARKWSEDKAGAALDSAYTIAGAVPRFVSEMYLTGRGLGAASSQFRALKPWQQGVGAFVAHGAGTTPGDLEQRLEAGAQSGLLGLTMTGGGKAAQALGIPSLVGESVGAGGATYAQTQDPVAAIEMALFPAVFKGTKFGERAARRISESAEAQVMKWQEAKEAKAKPQKPAEGPVEAAGAIKPPAKPPAPPKAPEPGKTPPTEATWDDLYRRAHVAGVKNAPEIRSKDKAGYQARIEAAEAEKGITPPKPVAKVEAPPPQKPVVSPIERGEKPKAPEVPKLTQAEVDARLAKGESVSLAETPPGEKVTKAKEPWEMGKKEFGEEFQANQKAVLAAEKHGPLPKGMKPWDAKDWKAWSRKRGYTEAEIAEFERGLVLAGDKQGFDYSDVGPDAIHRQHIERAHGAGKPVPPEVLAEYGLEPKGKLASPIPQKPAEGPVEAAGAIKPPAKPPAPPKAPEPGGKDEPIVQFKPDKSGAIRWVGHGLRKYFTAPGDLPQDVFDAKIASEGWARRQITQMGFTARDFLKATKDAYKGKNQIDYPAIRKVLSEGAKPETLPEGIREHVQKMRDEIDVFSQAFIDRGIVQGKLEVKFDENKGIYVTRTYKAFSDPEWAKKVPPEVRNKAQGWFRSQYNVPENTEALTYRELLRYARRHDINIRDLPDYARATVEEAVKGRYLTEDQIEHRIRALLYGGKAAEEGIIAVVRRGKLGSKDLSILTKRGKIPNEIRALLGEEMNPLTNYMETVTKVVNFLANDDFLTTVREAGLKGKFFFEKGDPNIDPAAKALIAAEKSEAMSPLNGLYTYPEVKIAFEEALGPKADYNKFLRFYFKANALVKYSKTVLGHVTHLRNFEANPYFAIVQGHWHMGQMEGATKTMAASLGLTSSPKWRAKFLRLQELNVVGESVHEHELRGAIQDGLKNNLDRTKILRTATKPFTEMYRVEDDFWKVYGFENEMISYRKIIPDLKAREQYCADIVRNSYPTWSNVPRAIRILRKFPVIGQFPSFYWEVNRTAYHTFRQITKEMKDPKTRHIGARRLVGLTVAWGAPHAAALASMFASGVTRDDDRAVREHVAPWEENSILVYLGDPENFIDLGFTDPASALKKPLTAFLRGKDWGEAMWEATRQALEPYASEEILWERLMDIARNKKKLGGRVFNPQDNAWKRWEDRFLHFWAGVGPGTVLSLTRLAKAYKGTINHYGKVYDPKTELWANLGVRARKLDIIQSLSFHAGDYQTGVKDASSALNRVASNRGTVSDEELGSAHTSFERSRRELFDWMHIKAQAAMQLGKTRREVRQAMITGGIAAGDVNNIINGRYHAWMPSDDFLQAVKRQRALNENAADKAEFNRRKRLLRDLGREAKHKRSTQNDSKNPA